MARYREAMRGKGLRPIQLWVQDTRAPGFRDRLRLDIQRINAADRADSTLAWLETVSVSDGDDPG